jgi:hypothetical protein
VLFPLLCKPDRISITCSFIIPSKYPPNYEKHNAYYK